MINKNQLINYIKNKMKNKKDYKRKSKNIYIYI